ncbi:MAG: efflux RND transporter periplasmic adaptor subunit [bacterium]|nr:efflux RND transporter periplasmic adaptor subunit [bacterium]
MPRVFPHARGFSKSIRGVLALLLAVVATSCSDTAEKKGPPDSKDKATPVAVVRVVQERVEGAFLEREATLHPVSQVVLSTRQEGFVLSRHMEDGDTLHKGDLVVEIDSTEHRLELAELRAAVRRTSATLDDAQRALARTQALFKKNVISEGERDDKRTALARAEADVAEARARLTRGEEALREFSVRAPMDSVVSDVFLEAGTYLERGDKIVHLKRIDNMLAVASISERYLSQIKEGMPVEVSVTAFPGRTFEGLLWKIIPDASLESRSFPVRILVPNLRHELKPGMSASVKFTHEIHDALLVPKDAVIGSKAHPYVFIASEEHAERREIEIGQAVGDRWHVLSGLTTEDWVVVTGNEELSEGREIQIVDLPTPGLPKLPTQLEAGRPEASDS